MGFWVNRLQVFQGEMYRQDGLQAGIEFNRGSFLKCIYLQTHEATLSLRSPLRRLIYLEVNKLTVLTQRVAAAAPEGVASPVSLSLVAFNSSL